MHKTHTHTPQHVQRERERERERKRLHLVAMGDVFAVDDKGALAVVGVADGDAFGFSEAVRVTGAPNDVLNGIYLREGFRDDVYKYVKECGSSEYPPCGRFVIYRCRLSNDSRRWYMSFVHAGSLPGTTEDIDFYSAPHNPTALNYNPNDPPLEGWMRLPTVGNRPTLCGNPGPGRGTLRVEPSFLNLVDCPPDADDFPVIRYTIIGDDECPVCCERFQVDEFRVRLGCRHYLHRGCLDQLRVKAIYECPLCRRCMYQEDE